MQAGAAFREFFKEKINREFSMLDHDAENFENGMFFAYNMPVLEFR